MKIGNCKNKCESAGLTLLPYKGDKGDKGSGIISVVINPSNSSQWLITFEDGTTSTIAAPPSAHQTYVAWADDLVGTNFSLTNYNSDYLAIISTIAGSTPVASDFLGHYFKIKNNIFNKSKNLNKSHHLTAPNTIAVNSVTSHQIPRKYWNNPGDRIDFEIFFTVTQILTGSSKVDLLFNINLGLPSLLSPTFQITNELGNATGVLKVTLYNTSVGATTSFNAYTECHIKNNGADIQSNSKEYLFRMFEAPSTANPITDIFCNIPFIVGGSAVTSDPNADLTVTILNITSKTINI